MGLSVELGSLTTANLMEKVKGLQNLAYQLGLEECEYMNDTNLTVQTVFVKKTKTKKKIWCCP